METVNLDEIFKELETINKFDLDLKQKCIVLAKAINENEITFHKIVENLGSLLVNQSPEKREIGTFILSQILENIPNDFMSTTELHFIATFYSDRLKDNHQVIPAVLHGIHIIVQMDNLPENAPHKLLTALFENVPCQQQQLKDRKLIYQIFKELLNRRSTELISMGLDFVLGVIQAMDGERDPRNLLYLFNWLPTFLTKVKLEHLTEEMFDVIACYFPVDFRVPAQESQNVTREDLASQLCTCLCAIPEFAEFCLPLIIDKLNASLKIAKLDSLNLLSESCKVFDVLIYEQYSHDIWNLLQKETLNSSDSEIEEASLNCISSITNRLARSENNTLFKRTVDNLYDSLKGNLRPETKLFLPSSKILLASACASKESCKYIAQPTIALLLNHYNLIKDHTQKVIVFRTLIEFAIAYLKLFEVSDIKGIEILNELPALCLQACSTVNEPEIRAISFESLARLAKMLSLEIRQTVYGLLKIEIVKIEPDNVRASILKCFKEFACLYKDEIIQEFLSSNNVNTENLSILQLYLDALSTIVYEQCYSKIILPQILDYITTKNLEVAKVSVICLKKILEQYSDNEHIQEYLFYECKIINKILTWILSIIKTDNVELDLLINISIIFKIIIGYQSIENQNSIMQEHLNELFNIYQNNDQVKNKIIILLEGILVRLRPEVIITDKYTFIKDLVKNSTIIEENVYLYACMIIANILNKSAEDEYFVEILNEIEQYVTNALENISNNLHLNNIIQLISWITKSLIIKGSNKSEAWTDKLISMLEKYEEVAKSFKLIMDGNQDCLSTKSFCTNRLLYRQKFFAYVCKKLSNTYNDDTPNHLLALGYLLQLAPLQVIILYFKETLRLLIFCLEKCKDANVLCAVLNTLCILIQSKEPYLEKHIDDLLTRFLNLTTFETSMRVRIAALKCIKEFPNNYPVYKLLPRKQDIIFGLALSLDDKKRLVRKQAVEARSHWFLLDAPT